jgi:FKBP-type peptidyl-prolyl cis-trans isomerase (trigger factor)
MNITKEETGALTATLKVAVSKEDYEEKVLKTLKDYQRKANMPGFRPGKVPFGLISKMYRKAVVLDEVNNLVADSLQDYISKNELRLIGNPLPDRERSTSFDSDDISDLEFYFDLGMAPDFSLDISGKLTVDYYSIKATEKMVDEYVEDLRKRYGTHQHDQAHDHDHEHEHEHEHPVVPAELNEEFFKMIFPGDDIKDETAFREKVREGIERSLVRESERYFLNTVIEKLVEETSIDLPDTFIRKMLRDNEENQMTEEQIDAQYDNFARSIRWQLIESRLMRDHGVKVEEEDMRNAVKGYFTGNVVPQDDNPERDERLNKIVDSVLSNREEANRLHDQLFDQKMLEFFKSNVTLKNKDMNYDDFVKLVTEKK